MKLKHTNKRTTPNLSQPLLAQFPPELLDRIIGFLLRDIDTTLDELKSFRLVCKNFNHAAQPRVLSCVRLFGNSENPMSNMLQLQAMLSPNPKGHLHSTTTLVIGDWEWRYGKQLSTSGWRALCVYPPGLLGIIFSSILVSVASLIAIFRGPHLILHDSVARSLTKYCLSRGSVLNMPNVRRVIWKVELVDTRWITSNAFKLLLGFSQLSELVLVIDYEHGLNDVLEGLSKLHNLRKLRIEVLKWWLIYLNELRPDRDPLTNLGQVVAANLNLTHLELYIIDKATVSCSQIFGQVPAGTTLKLEHLCVSDSFTDVQAIIPHARNLVSIEIYGCGNNILPALHSNSVFPPFIGVPSVRDVTINYLKSHPRIVGLSINGTTSHHLDVQLLEIMARHSESLTYFSSVYLDFLCLVRPIQNELLLLQCTNLKQLVILYSDFEAECNNSMKIGVNTLPVISRLPSSLTLVITKPKVFRTVVEYCSQSEDPLIHDLTGRTVYEEGQPRWTGCPYREWDDDWWFSAMG